MSFPWFDCCDCRTGKKGYPPDGLGNLDTDKLCGVGITFVEDTNGALYVKNLVPDGSAARSGLIHIGDVLFEVNGTNVYCEKPETIGNLLLGTEGSPVELVFKRASTGNLHRVTLYRTSVATSPAAQAQGASLQKGNGFSSPAKRL
mmetsp:Transcript_6572/g.15006  ORF Transcript_6572/g.15006 Transcript_6572/m.15006 type:complete len:146 (-) Transcript_6572:122-559(-)